MTILAAAPAAACAAAYVASRAVVARVATDPIAASLSFCPDVPVSVFALVSAIVTHGVLLTLVAEPLH